MHWIYIIISYNKVQQKFLSCLCAVGHWRGTDDDLEGQSDPQSQTEPGLELGSDHHYTEGKREKQAQLELPDRMIS